MYNSSKMTYDYSEDYSDLIINVAGGSTNCMCSFCNINKKAKSKLNTLEEFYKQMEKRSESCNSVRRIFVINDNVNFVSSDIIKNLLANINKYFPKCKDTALCTEPPYILNQTEDELKQFNKLGLNTINLGIETGSERVLVHIKKCISQNDIVNAGMKIKKSGIKLSICLISGIGGKDRWIEHAIESAKVINKLDPYSVRILGFNHQKNSEITKEISNGNFVKLSSKYTAMEIEKFVEHVQVSDCIFICNQFSANSDAKRILPYDKQRILNDIERHIKKVYIVK